MSRHVDLIAVAALVVAVAFAARVHDLLQLHAGPAHLFRTRILHPVMVMPPHPAAFPEMPQFPRVEF